MWVYGIYGRCVSCADLLIGVSGRLQALLRIRWVFFRVMLTPLWCYECIIMPRVGTGSLILPYCFSMYSYRVPCAGTYRKILRQIQSNTAGLSSNPVGGWLSRSVVSTVSWRKIRDHWFEYSSIQAALEWAWTRLHEELNHGQCIVHVISMEWGTFSTYSATNAMLNPQQRPIVNTRRTTHKILLSFAQDDCTE